MCIVFLTFFIVLCLTISKSTRDILALPVPLFARYIIIWKNWWEQEIIGIKKNLNLSTYSSGVASRYMSLCLCCLDNSRRDIKIVRNKTFETNNIAERSIYGPGIHCGSVFFLVKSSQFFSWRGSCCLNTTADSCSPLEICFTDSTSTTSFFGICATTTMTITQWANPLHTTNLWWEERYNELIPPLTNVIWTCLWSPTNDWANYFEHYHQSKIVKEFVPSM